MVLYKSEARGVVGRQKVIDGESCTGVMGFGNEGIISKRISAAIRS